jgi:hypothetical protein
MSYTITHANGTNPIVIADGTVDTSTSITLVGRNTPSYGQYLDQNFLNMLENFSNSSSPVNPISGQLWYNSTQGTLKIYNGTAFKNVSNATSGSSSPINPNIGDFWWDTVNGQLDVYNGSMWVVVGPVATGTVVAETIIDTSSVPHNVISFQINNTRYAILSKDIGTFHTNILGFSTIGPGFNIASTSFVTNNRFVGTATNSDALGSVGAASFMRADQNTSTVGILSVTNNTGINVGTSGQASINITGNEVHLDNTQNNGIIRLRTKTAAGVADALDILGNADVQINGNLFVLGNLDVTTSTETSIVSGVNSSYNTTSGAFQVVGGVGIGGNINVGGPVNTFSGNVIVANLQTSGNVYADYINAGVLGNNGASLVGTINTAAQPQITSLGTLTGLQVSGTAGFTGGTVTFNPTSANKLVLGNVGNVQILGGTSLQFLQTDGSGNMTWSTVYIPVGASATAGQIPVYSNSNYIAGNAGVTYNGNLNITGNILATNDIVAFYSDQRLKTDITPITNALEKVNKINGVTYYTNDIADKLGIGDNREHVGVIAQEIQSVLPQVIHSAPFDLDENGISKSGENYLTVQYDKIIPLLIQAIKELSAEVEALKARGS